MMQEISQHNLKLQLALVRRYITEFSIEEITIVEYRTYQVSAFNDYVEYFIIPKTNASNALEAFAKLYNCQLHFFEMATVLPVNEVIDVLLKDIDKYCFDEILANTIGEAIEWYVNCAQNSMCGYLGYPEKLGIFGNIYVNNEPYLSKSEFRSPISGTILSAPSTIAPPGWGFQTLLFGKRCDRSDRGSRHNWVANITTIGSI